MEKLIWKTSVLKRDYSDYPKNLFSSKDLNIKSVQCDILRDKLEEVEKELIKYSQRVCPNRPWDYYVTSYKNTRNQWAAIFPMKVVEHRKYNEFISCWPNIILKIPMNGQDIMLSLNLEFKLPRELLYSQCSSPQSIERLMTNIKGAKDAVISVRKKLILNNDNRTYRWLEALWDDINLPDINTSQCTSKYLENLSRLMQNTVPNKYIDKRYEPIFLIKYQIPQEEFLSNPKIIEYLGEKVSLLAPIMDFIAK